ncbi:MAG: hypothetical protein ACRDV4_00520 [Acidimicrobiales bacterium]
MADEPQDSDFEKKHGTPTRGALQRPPANWYSNDHHWARSPATTVVSNAPTVYAGARHTAAGDQLTHSWDTGCAQASKQPSRTR